MEMVELNGRGFHFQVSQLESHNSVPISQSQQPIKKRSYITSFSPSIRASTQRVRRNASIKETSTKTGVGQIVEVKGGHIVRATGLKDRHSKVCTAKGPRERRVRLSAHTAIQFYDVQDRLGYDRPSKAVDWLINKAKAAIDELEELPAWSPSSMNVSTVKRPRGGKSFVVEELDDDKGGEEQQELYNNSSCSLLPPCLDSDAIADTIKSFFPMDGANAGPTTTRSASESPMHFQDYRQGEFFRRGDGNGNVNGRQGQDLKLSLQSFQDPILMHHGGRAAHAEQQQSLYRGSIPIGFENPDTGWAYSEHQPNPELGRLHKLIVGWNTQHNEVGANSGNVNGNGGGFYFNQTSPLLQPLFGGGQHSQLFSQRGPLQSSNTHSIRAWISDPSFSTANHYHPQAVSGLGFNSGVFSGFHFPARIQGHEEHDGDHNKPPSLSTASQH